MEIQIESSEPIPDRVGQILRGLPEWFGIDESIDEYVDAARRLPTYIAKVGDEVVGVCLVEHHNPVSSEIHLIAIERRFHRQGLGRAMLERVTADLVAERREFLQVKTLGASRPSDEYAATRRFYEALGYRPLQEFAVDELWPGNPCLIMVKHLPT